MSEQAKENKGEVKGKGEVKKRTVLLKERISRKVPLMRNPEGQLHVLQQLDDTGGASFKPRPLKFPGHFGFEALFQVELTKDGKEVHHRWTQMWRRGYQSGAYNMQQYLHRRRNSAEMETEDNLKGLEVFDRIYNGQPGAKKGEAQADGYAERMSKAPGTDVQPFKDRIKVSFGMPPYENVLEFDEKKRLMGPKGPGQVVPAPRLLADRSEEFMIEGEKKASAPGPVVSAPRLLTDQSESFMIEGGEKKAEKTDDGPRAIAGPAPVMLLPAPRPAQRREAPPSEVKRSFDLVRAGRTAAKRAAVEKGRAQANKVKKAAGHER